MSRPSPSSFPPAVEVEAFPFEHSSPLSLRQQPCSSPPAPPAANLAQTHDYNCSGSVYDGSGSGAESEDQLPEEDEEEEQEQEEDLLDTERRISGCSSISSFPASVSQPLPPRQGQYGSPRTPTKHALGGTPLFEKPAPSRGVPYPSVSPTSSRKYNSPFRHPSSVKALQMRDEVISDTQSVLRHRTNSGSQRSSYSHRTSYSPHASSNKRFTKSSQGSPKPNSNLRTEFPLVLLHCTLLPPSLLLRSTAQDDALIAELLPEEFRERWVALQDKLVGDVEIQTRGILIAHPKEDYELLEERLLESLDLETPRIRHNHYFQADATGNDSGFESGSLTGDETDQECPHNVKCPDCGRRVATGEISRKWEIKVFAANGLMRAGAWAAAWHEMEKVDVEVKVWLPEKLQRELEAKLALIETSSPEVAPAGASPLLQSQNTQISREREIYGKSGRQDSPSEPDEFYDLRRPDILAGTAPSFAPTEPDLNMPYLGLARDFAHERKGLFVAVLSLMVLLFAWAGRQSAENQTHSPPAFPSAPFTEVSTTTVTTTSIAISTATVTATLNMETPCSSLSEAAIMSTSVPSTSNSQTPMQMVSQGSVEASVQNRMAPGIRSTPLLLLDPGSS
ncbi:hypothetical protein A1O3_04343 [Capronia epimyces CBS 606.96]|uniref:Uncharacterized protein n=1 Tax=Capronia epimyces CBS 606.96 TaxID=1182542 RepID=W9YYM7_9EURO|nr:uncharacterized protein A1O3_04343 [Capronia epimyces CBS 606.96]EXJ87384.1 hypothetical protein A1O3_04343 [Capronia epimyces CBS 606.96]